MSDTDRELELARLRAENTALNEQIKLLVQTEQRLYRSQNERDVQLESIRALARFALDSASDPTPELVIERSLGFLNEAFVLDWTGFAWLVPESGRIERVCSVPASESAGREVEPDAEVRSWLASITVPLLVSTAESGAAGPAERCLRQMRNGPGDDGPRCPSAKIVCLPIRRQKGERRGIILACALDHGSGRLRQGELHDGHLPFLQLVVSHIERAIENAALSAHLREHGAALAASLENLEDAQRELLQSQKLEAVGRLAGGVAHDFNNLLTVILGYSSTLRASLVSPAQQRNLDQIIEAGQRAAALTSQLLALGRRQFQRRENLPLSELTGRTLDLLRRLVGEHISLALELDKDLPPVHADRSQVEQVVLNLVVNARDAMPEGGRMIVRTRRADSRDAARCAEAIDPAGFAVVEVVDNGTGMDEATRGRIFEPFFTTKPSGEGSGLGLAMVYGVVKQSEGHVMVESAPGRGARFSVLLPFAREVEEPIVPEGVPCTGSRDATVLVVEDEAMIRNVVANTLRGEGYRVRVAQNGEDALALVRREALPLDLLLTDVVMPKLGGVRLAEALRGMQAGLRVLFISGYSEDLVASGHVGNHDDLFLAKPFTSQALLEQVARALSRPVGNANVPRR